MAITDFHGGLWLGTPTWEVSGVPMGVTNVGQMDADGEKNAMIIRIPRSGTLAKVHFRSGTVTDAPDNGIRISFQDLSGATGDPDGGVDQFRNVPAPIAANTWYSTGLITSNGTDGGTKRDVVAGQLLAIVADFVSFVAGDNFSAFSGVSTTAGASRADYHFTYTSAFAGGSWFRATSVIPILALEYTDGIFCVFDHYMTPVLTSTSININTGTSPDEVGLRFQVPFKCAIDGCAFRANFGGNGEIVLYDASNNVLATCPFTANARTQTSDGTAIFRWVPVTLLANTTYRIVLKPTTATNISLYYITFADAAYQAAMPGGSSWYYTSRTDAGAWSDTTTRRPLTSLHISGIDSGGSGAFSAAYMG